MATLHDSENPKKDLLSVHSLNYGRRVGLDPPRLDDYRGLTRNRGRGDSNAPLLSRNRGSRNKNIKGPA